MKNLSLLSIRLTVLVIFAACLLIPARSVFAQDCVDDKGNKIDCPTKEPTPEAPTPEPPKEKTSTPKPSTLQTVSGQSLQTTSTETLEPTATASSAAMETPRPTSTPEATQTPYVITVVVEAAPPIVGRTGSDEGDSSSPLPWLSGAGGLVLGFILGGLTITYFRGRANPPLPGSPVPGGNASVLDNGFRPTGDASVLDNGFRPTNDASVLDNGFRPTNDASVLDNGLRPTGDASVLDNGLRPTGDASVLDNGLRPTDDASVLDNGLRSMGTPPER